MRVKGRILDFCAEITIEKRFENVEEFPIEAVYPNRIIYYINSQTDDVNIVIRYNITLSYSINFSSQNPSHSIIYKI